MIERFLFAQLTERIAEFVASERRLRRALYMLKVPRTERDRVATAYIAKPPVMKHAFPRKDPPFPLYCLVLGRRRDDLKFLGDHGHDASTAEAELLGDSRISGAEVISVIKHGFFRILTITDDADFTIHYDGLLEVMLDRSLFALKDEWGVSNSTRSTSDLHPLEVGLPAHLFVREMTLELEYEFSTFGEGAGFVRHVDLYADDVPVHGHIHASVAEDDDSDVVEEEV